MRGRPEPSRRGGVAARTRVGAGGAGDELALRVAHGLRMLEVAAPARWSVGRLKGLLAEETGVPAEFQELLLRGRKLPDGKPLVDAGLRPRVKIVLAERPGYRRGAGNAGGGAGPGRHLHRGGPLHRGRFQGQGGEEPGGEREACCRESRPP